MFKLALTAGHAMNTGRGVPASLSKYHPNEWQLNDKVCDAIEKRLKEYDGISVLRIDDTTGQNYTELYYRTDKANKWGADFYLSIHHNGGMGGGNGGGIVAYVYTNTSAESVAWQKDLYNALIAKTGLKGNRATPLARENLHEVREPNMPSVLLELGFMDSVTDIKTILANDFADKCADAIVSVIVKRKGLRKKEETMKKGETNLGIYAMKRLLMLAKAFGIVPNAVADDGGYGEGVDTDVKAVQKRAGLTQKSEANEATIRAIFVQTLDALNAERKKSATELNAAKAETAKIKASVSAMQKRLDEMISGDVNKDGAVNTKDLLELRKILSE